MINFLKAGPDEEEQAGMDNRSELMNPESDNYDDDHGSNTYDVDEHTQDENDNRSDQMNPNNDAYSSSRR